MFNLGQSFSLFVIYALVWVVGYFIWAIRSEK